MAFFIASATVMINDGSNPAAIETGQALVQYVTRNPADLSQAIGVVEAVTVDPKGETAAARTLGEFGRYFTCHTFDFTHVICYLSLRL